MNVLVETETPFDHEQTLDELEASFELPPATSEPAPPTVDPEQQQLQLYSITTRQIESLKAKCLELACDTPKGYDDTRRMIGLLRTTRTRIEKRRKEHNAEHQEAIRFVNGIAKQLTSFIENLEEPLKLQKLEVDDAKERARRAAEEAEKQALEAKVKAEREAEEARLKEIRDAEAEKNRVEAERLAKERAEMEERRRQMDAELAASEARARALQEQVATERQAMEDFRLAFERDERERQAKIQAERELAEYVVREEKRLAAHMARLEAMKPDVEKVHAYAQVIRNFPKPAPVDSKEAMLAIDEAMAGLEAMAIKLEAFQP
jgi:chromosome segregation ATPase